MEKIHKIINIYINPNKVTVIDNVYHFIFSKIVWEPYIVELLKLHGYNAFMGSDDTDFDTSDILIKSKDNNIYYGVDFKSNVWSKFKNNSRCVPVSPHFYKSIYTNNTYNRFILFYNDKSLYCVAIHKLRDIAGHYVSRPNWMYEFLIYDILSLKGCKELCKLKDSEWNTLLRYKYILDNSNKEKVKMPSTLSIDEKLKILNEAVHNLKLDERYIINFNFIIKEL